jgi:hypothetical protein
VADSNISGIGRLSQLAADSAIMGARGNSGVILAQLFRGIHRGLEGKETATADQMGKAFQYGILYAYRAVARPVEGTILTVAKGIAKGARKAVSNHQSFAEIMVEAIRVGELELARTPELLPALKEAGVVDAGGRGLLVLLTGCLVGLTGQVQMPLAKLPLERTAKKATPAPFLTHPYCTEFMVEKANIKIGSCKQQLDELGQSLVVAEAHHYIKVHIHTAHPGKVLETALAWGHLHDIKVENMADQHSSLVAKSHKPQKVAVISVSPGAGLTEMMMKLGATWILDGGQTMNPSVEQFADIIHRGQADQYIILPNNNNIILAAAQVEKLFGQQVAVVPTKNIPQGLAALVAFQAGNDLASNIQAMLARSEKVKAAAITTAVRNSRAGGQVIQAGQYIGVIDGEVQTVAGDMETTLRQLLARLVDAQDELISIYYGADLDIQGGEKLADLVAAQFPQLVVEIYGGGQPHYQLLLGVE